MMLNTRLGCESTLICAICIAIGASLNQFAAAPNSLLHGRLGKETEQRLIATMLIIPSHSQCLKVEADRQAQLPPPHSPPLTLPFDNTHLDSTVLHEKRKINSNEKSRPLQRKSSTPALKSAETSRDGRRRHPEQSNRTWKVVCTHGSGS